LEVYSCNNFSEARQENNPQSATAFICEPLGFMLKEESQCTFGTFTSSITLADTSACKTAKFLPTLKKTKVIIREYY